MRIFRQVFVIVLMPAVLPAGILAARAAERNSPTTPAFRAGFAERDVTPDAGMEMMGNYGKQYGQSIHDPCKVRAAVFDDGTNRVALVGLDSLIIQRESVLRVRKAITDRCGVPGDHVLLGASHSHSSGPVGWVMPGQYDHAPALVQELAYKKSPCADPGYLRRFERGILDAVCDANDARVTARLCFGSGREDKVSFNRRLRMKNGTTFTHPGKGNPNSFEYAGPIDPEVGVIGAWDTNGALLGVVVNFSCHATTSPPGFSANWIFYLEKTIRGALGAQAPVVFLQGACGDLTQVDNLSPYAEGSGDEQARRVGGSVGAEAVKLLLRTPRGQRGAVEARSKVWMSKRRNPSAGRVKRSLELVQKPEKEVGHTEWIFAKEIVLLDALIAKWPEEEVEVQTIQIGPAVFISNPAEYFVEYGLELKRRSNFKLTWIVELANGCVGYVPTDEALGPKGGGYETRLTSYSNLEIGAGRKFLEAGLALARQLTPGKLPEPPRAPPWSAPWSYGNVPPEKK
jgi:hypothetical protein